MANDPLHFLLVAFCLFGSLTTLLVLAAIDQQTDHHHGLTRPGNHRPSAGPTDSRRVQVNGPARPGKVMSQ